jgi:hypothetical protein
MHCEKAHAVFPELLDRRTSLALHLEARAHLAACPTCQREYASLAQVASLLDAPAELTPSPRLRQNFYALLEEEKHSAASTRAVAERNYQARTASLWRWVVAPLGGCTLLVLGFLLGLRFAPAPSPAPHDETTRRQLVELQQKVDTMGQWVGSSLLRQQQSPTHERLRGVLASATATQPDARVINELISALALDPSAHVRLRALDGLTPHLEKEVVRAGVLSCLVREENPLVLVSMMDLLATARETNARPALERISLNESADRAVRDAASRALAQL